MCRWVSQEERFGYYAARFSDGLVGEKMADWVVVVDDDKEILQEAEGILSRKGFRVTMLSSGEAFHTFLGKHDAPDIVLMDTMMPGMNGFDTYTLLREKEDDLALPNLPVVFMTTDYDVDSEARGLRLGVSDFVRKPFDPDVLVQRVECVIEGNRRMLKFREDATTDRLTGFLNKETTNNRLSRVCTVKTGCLIMLDLDFFKMVNDIYGHAMGDRVLELFAKCIRNNISPGSECGRIGGDEFLIFSADIKAEIDVRRFSDNLNEEFSSRAKTLMDNDTMIPLGVSVGAAFVPEQGRDFDRLYRYVDKALYKVKRNGKHSYSIYRGGESDENVMGADMSLDKLSSLWEERGMTSGAMWPGRDVFEIVYHFAMRIIKRYRLSVYRLLFTVKYDKESEPEDVREDTMVALGKLIQRHLRMSDVMTEAGAHQYYVMIFLVDEDQARSAADRIITAWKESSEGKTAQLDFTLSKVEIDEKH